MARIAEIGTDFSSGFEQNWSTWSTWQKCQNTFLN